MNIASRETKSPTEDVRMMEIIVTRQNMRRAYNRVMANKGAPGVDGMTVGQLKSFLKRCWPEIKQALVGGTYRAYA
jgi:RNA-directed DNA polymerase